MDSTDTPERTRLHRTAFPKTRKTASITLPTSSSVHFAEIGKLTVWRPIRSA